MRYIDRNILEEKTFIVTKSYFFELNEIENKNISFFELRNIENIKYFTY